LQESNLSKFERLSLKSRRANHTRTIFCMSCGNTAQILSICRRVTTHAEGDKAPMCPFSGNETYAIQLEPRAEREMH
jgi:hypothetical protein